MNFDFKNNAIVVDATQSNIDSRKDFNRILKKIFTDNDTTGVLLNRKSFFRIGNTTYFDLCFTSHGSSAIYEEYPENITFMTIEQFIEFSKGEKVMENVRANFDTIMERNAFLMYLRETEQPVMHVDNDIACLVEHSDYRASYERQLGFDITLSTVCFVNGYWACCTKTSEYYRKTVEVSKYELFKVASNNIDPEKVIDVLGEEVRVSSNGEFTVTIGGEIINVTKDMVEIVKEQFDSKTLLGYEFYPTSVQLGCTEITIKEFDKFYEEYKKAIN